MQRLNCNESPNIMEDWFLFIITANWDEIHGGSRAHLRHSEQQRHSIEEIGVGAASIDPEVPEHWEERRAGQQGAGHQEDVPQNCNTRRKWNMSLFSFGQNGERQKPGRLL